MKIRALCVICLAVTSITSIGGCSAADGQSDDRSQIVHDLGVQEPDEAENPALERDGVVELSAPASARKPTPDPWRIAPAFDKPTPDPWSGEACDAPPEESTGECATGHETGTPSARPQTLDP
jgi:hypothetical protein